MRRGEQNVVKKVLSMEVEGNGNGRGRPRLKWMDCVKKIWPETE